MPPTPFTLSELEPDVLPDRVYTKPELLSYLDHSCSQCRAVIEGLTEKDQALDARLIGSNGFGPSSSYTTCSTCNITLLS